ncbi:MAG: AAA family ATPase [Pseudomonadota bacterium]
MMPRVLALANQKGGVGKTTTAINLGTALAAIGQTVLIIDIDPQGNASTGLGVDRENRETSTYDVMVGELALADVVCETAIPNLLIAPSTLDLLGVELLMAGDSRRNYRIRDEIDRLGSKGLSISGDDRREVDYVLVDCPPSLNLLTMNALTAADAVIVPLQCEFYALEGLSQLLNTVEQVKTALNPDLFIHGIVMTMYDQRNRLARQVVEDVRSTMGSKVYDTIIPRNVRISEAPSYGKPALLYDVKCSGSQAYVRLATEVVRRERALQAA